MNRSGFIYLIISFTILLGLSFKKEDIISSSRTQNYFVGDQKLSDKLYFKTLNGKEGYEI